MENVDGNQLPKLKYRCYIKKNHDSMDFELTPGPALTGWGPFCDGETFSAHSPLEY